MLNFDKAVLQAREQKIPVVLGLASELAGVFYLSTGAAVTAKPHLTTAYQAYMVRPYNVLLLLTFADYVSVSPPLLMHLFQDWGAVAKVKALIRRLPFVDFGSSIKADSTSTGSSNERVLHAQVDVESIVKASKVLTAEPTYVKKASL